MTDEPMIGPQPKPKRRQRPKYQDSWFHWYENKGPWFPIEPWAAWVQGEMQRRQLTQLAMANELGCSPRLIYAWLKRDRVALLLSTIESFLWKYNTLTVGTVFDEDLILEYHPSFVAGLVERVKHLDKEGKW